VIYLRVYQIDGGVIAFRFVRKLMRVRDVSKLFVLVLTECRNYQLMRYVVCFVDRCV